MDSNVAFSVLFLAIFFVGGMISLLATAFWIWMLVDCATKTPSEGNLKLIWILVLVFTGIVGALVYFFVQRPKNPPHAGVQNLAG